MTLQRLIDALSSLGVPVYQLVAVHSDPAYIVLTLYGGTSIQGDDASFVLLDKVQLDILYQDPSHALLHNAYVALSEAGFAYDISDVAYDPDYARIRAILQLEAV